MKKIKILAFDIDGTILPFNSTDPSDATVDAVRRVSENGVVCLPCTGRAVDTVPEKIIQLPEVRYIIYSNGAGVYDSVEKRHIFHNPMEKADAYEILDILYKCDFPIEIFSLGKMVIEKKWVQDLENCMLPAHHIKTVKDGHMVIVDSLMDFLADENNVVDKVNIPIMPADKREELGRLFKKSKNYAVVSSGSENLEIGNLSTNKGAALAHIAKLLDVPMDAVMAIGDNNNDLEMLSVAGFGVAMENATPEAKAAADVVCGNCSDDGAAKAILQYCI